MTLQKQSDKRNDIYPFLPPPPSETKKESVGFQLDYSIVIVIDRRAKRGGPHDARRRGSSSSLCEPKSPLPAGEGAPLETPRPARDEKIYAFLLHVPTESP